ncbi:MAG: DNA replication/repair protein RecF [Ruminococcaceae bacterium]|nr:DNA replication/repair protein RecF [Oscillospiraceae bacterium]
MVCRSVRVKNFRNISEAEVTFSEGVNVLVGENAQGKSNLLEAIFYPSVGRSFRSSHTSEMIRFGQSEAEIELSYRDDRRDQVIRVKIFRDKQRQVEKNGLRIDKLSDLVGSFRTVLFFPEHLSMIRSGPAERRSYLDPAISRLYPRYIHSLQRYHYFLKQRNALIKSAYGDRKTFDATVELWSKELAKEAAILSEYRLSFVRRVSEHVAHIFEEMTGEKEIPTVHYKGSSGQPEEEYGDLEKTEDMYFSLLMSSHDREIAAGATLWGIHKDDMEIQLNGKSARIYASQGQQRSLALALKLAEGEITREEFGDEPVLLLDDVLSELDGSRREYLIHKIKDKQVILTGCEPTLLSELDDVHRILVREGTYFSFEKEK